MSVNEGVKAGSEVGVLLGTIIGVLDITDIGVSPTLAGEHAQGMRDTKHEIKI